MLTMEGGQLRPKVGAPHEKRDELRNDKEEAPRRVHHRLQQGLAHAAYATTGGNLSPAMVAKGCGTEVGKDGAQVS